MKQISLAVSIIAITLSLLFGFTGNAEAAVRVKGYVKPSTGRYVTPHYRSNPDSYKFNNYSSRGNYNPFTGRKGYSRW